jgi:hypothetical protein
MFEVDAECALRDRYSKSAKRRADYYVKLLVQDIGRNDNLPDELRATYCWPRYYLRPELAGTLTRDHRIEALLFGASRWHHRRSRRCSMRTGSGEGGCSDARRTGLPLA